jgi:hypothetical protein
MIIAKGINSDYMLFANSGTGTARMRLGSSFLIDSVSTITTDVWTHALGTYDGSNLKIYLNGSLDNTVSQTGAIPSTSASLQIGAANGGNKITGKIDETAVFNKALNQTEISQVYNNGYAADLTSLSPVSWWRLGEDAYFVGNDITIPNQISGAPNGTGAGTQTSILVANAPGSYASGVGTNLDVEDRKGEAPESTANSQSINMIPGDVHPYPPGYVPAQVNNVASMDFDGVSGQNVNLGTISSLNSASAFTISFWSNFDTPQTNDGVIFTNRVDNNNRISIYRYNTSIYFHVNSSGR